MIDNASATAILRAQDAFAGAAKDFDISNVDDVQNLADEVRYGVDIGRPDDYAQAQEIYTRDESFFLRPQQG